MEYLEYSPSPPLRRYVQCYWTLRMHATTAGIAESIFPDGRPELVFHLGDPFIDAATGLRQPSALLVGQMSGPVRLRTGGRIDVFGIRLRHAACESVVGLQPRDAVDRISALDEACRAARAELWHELGESRTAVHRVNVAERWLLRRIEDCIDPVAEAVATALAAGRAIPDCGLGGRQIRRRFAAAIGIPPAPFFRITRFQRALRSIDCQPLAIVAADAGYADQSHFTREFRDFAGCTPREYLAARGLGWEFVQSPLAEEACPESSRQRP